MASRQVQLFATTAIVFAIACLPALGAAMDWTVGDNDGWRAGFNKTGWTDGKTFRVGDTLLFKYTKGQHTVVEVNGADFRACNLQGQRLGAWNTGNDVVRLQNPGRRWFICDVAGHCDGGMKMLITVLDAGAPAPMTPATRARRARRPRRPRSPPRPQPSATPSAGPWPPPPWSRPRSRSDQAVACDRAVAPYRSVPSSLDFILSWGSLCEFFVVLVLSFWVIVFEI
ncbi:hypothetical protein EJB05_15059, partial [Eragrostis curvula]